MRGYRGVIALVLLNVAHYATAQGPCAGFSVSNNTDFGGTTRCAQYPNGIVLASYEACCSTCAATPGCTGWTYELDGSRTCFPLTAFSGRVSNHPSVIGTLPSPSPQPTPAAWVPKIAACDMLYSPSDKGVSSQNMPMVGNGFIATQVSSSDMYIAGLFNGYSTVSPSHRARIPATGGWGMSWWQAKTQRLSRFRSCCGCTGYSWAGGARRARGDVLPALLHRPVAPGRMHECDGVLVLERGGAPVGGAAMVRTSRHPESPSHGGPGEEGRGGEQS